MEKKSLSEKSKDIMEWVQPRFNSKLCLAERRLELPRKHEHVIATRDVPNASRPTAPAPKTIA